MSKTLKVGIAGYGVVGKRRRTFIDKHPGLQTVAVCDQYFEGSGQFEDGIKYFKSYQELLKEPLDALFVCVPNYLAPEATMAGLNLGLHVFCEKPPGRNVQDIRDVIKVEKENPQCKLKYGFNHRYHDSVQDALKIIQSKELGEIVNLRGVYGKSKVIPFSGGWRASREQAGGGILLDQGIHMLDMMRLFCGEFQDIKSFISNDYWKHDVEDNAYALLRDQKGRVAMIHSSATQWQHKFSLHIALTEGYLILKGILSGSKSYGEEKLIKGWRDQEADTGASRQETYNYLKDHSWKDEIDEFADAVLENKPLAFGTSEDALKTMELVYGIYTADNDWKNKFDIQDPRG